MMVASKEQMKAQKPSPKSSFDDLMRQVVKVKPEASNKVAKAKARKK